MTIIYEYISILYFSLFPTQGGVSLEKNRSQYFFLKTPKNMTPKITTEQTRHRIAPFNVNTMSHPPQMSVLLVLHYSPE